MYMDILHARTHRKKCDLTFSVGVWYGVAWVNMFLFLAEISKLFHKKQKHLCVIFNHTQVFLLLVEKF